MILNKRIKRELKKNFFRYLALFLVILVSMYIVISMAGGAETVIQNVNKIQVDSNVEDGQIEVLAPYSDKDIKEIKKYVQDFERCFYLDFTYGKNAGLRIFEERQKIDLLTVDKGGINPAKKDEIVLEKHFAEANHLKVGSKIVIADIPFIVVGTGSTPDYDCVLDNLTDIGSTASQFGTAFLSKEGYELLRASGKATKAETCNYSYKLKSSVSSNEFRDALNEIYVDNDQVKNPYIREIIDEVNKKKEKIDDSVQKLADGGNDIYNGTKELQDGSQNLTDGLAEITNKSDDIVNGADRAFDAILDSMSKQLKSKGVNVTLSQSNYETKLNLVLSKLEKGSEQYTQIVALKSTCDSFKKYLDGVKTYTEAVSSAQTGSAKLQDGISKVMDGAIKLSDGTEKFNKEIKRFLEDNTEIKISNLTYFLKAEDNPRIGGSVDDIAINKIGALIVGIIVLILLAYILSVFTIHSIEEESPVIGALYSLGYVKRELLGHYLVLPVLVCFIGGIAGTAAGFFGIPSQVNQNCDYFSYPAITIKFPMYLIIYGIIVPPVVAAVVNTLVIGRKLSKEPLKLLRREKKELNNSNIDLKNMGFITRFRIRLFLREIRSSLTLTAGLFVSLLVLMLSICCYNAVINIINQTDRDVAFNYLYYYKFPPETVPKGGEACYMKKLKAEIFQHNMDVTVMGLPKNSEFFDFDMEKGKDFVYVSTSTADKYGLKEKDTFSLSDEINNVSYEFKVKEIVQYAVGLYVFMDIDSMRELFNQEDNYYNAVLSKDEISTENDRLYSVTTGKEIRKYSELFMDLNKSMIISLIAASTFLFIIVMYLMLKMIIEKQSYNISLFKMFGYNEKEIGKLFLGSNFFIVTISALICVPLAEFVMKSIYPMLVSNRATGFDLSLHPFSYAFILGLIYISYFAVNVILKKKLSKIAPNDVLKNRE